MCLRRIGVVTRVWDAEGVPMAIVEIDDRAEPVSLITAAAAVGDRVVVQFGFVVEVLTERRAQDAERLRSEAEASLGRVAGTTVHVSGTRRNEP